LKKHYRYLLVLLVVLSAGALIYSLHGNQASPPAPTGELRPVGRAPQIHPDYSGTVIPANIAPLNFLIQEDGSQYYVKIYSQQGPQIEVGGRSPKIAIPQRAWRRLLNANAGEQLHFDVSVKDKEGRWSRFDAVTNTIAPEPIDDYLVYRKIHPAYGAWKRMGVYQRSLRSFDESAVLDNTYFADGCLNCHAFCNNRTDKMLIGIRSMEYGSAALLAQNGKVEKIGTKFGYTAWHPSGRVAAYSVNQVVQFFHSAEREVRDVLDLNSLIAYYLIDSKTAKTAPALAQKDRLETYPAWSPDGRYLYFCSAPLSWSVYNVIPQQYDQIKYDLVRIAYDVDRDKWGEVETVLSAGDTGLSILLPRISPDGRWLLFCMCDYGCFPVYRSSSDLYIMDLKAGLENGRYKYRRLNINSDQSESWHSWSSNSRWIAFSSKRGNGTFTRSYLAYVGSEGAVHKPLLVPQKDPTHYDSYLWTYSVPELVIEPVKATKEKLGRVVRGSRKIPIDFPITMATPKGDALPAHDEPWMQLRE